MFRGLDDSCPLSDMKSTDDFAVCQLEHPWTEGGEEAVSKTGRVYTIPAFPAAGEVSSPDADGAETTVGENDMIREMEKKQ